MSAWEGLSESPESYRRGHLADAVERLSAENAEKDRRIATLEAELARVRRTPLVIEENPNDDRYANLISVISDIRKKSGVGGKPMLSELADAIQTRINGLQTEVEACERAVALRCAEIATYGTEDISATIHDEFGLEPAPTPSR
jgi:hypothetical protein